MTRPVPAPPPNLGIPESHTTTRRVVLHIDSDGPPAAPPRAGTHWFIDGDDWWTYDPDRQEWVRGDPLVYLRQPAPRDPSKPEKRG